MPCGNKNSFASLYSVTKKKKKKKRKKEKENEKRSKPKAVNNCFEKSSV